MRLQKGFGTTFHLVYSARRGEDEAFRLLVERYYYVGEKWLKYQGLPSWVSSGDVLGEVFRTLLADPSIVNDFDFAKPKSFRRYFYMMLRNRLITILRRHDCEVRSREMLGNQPSEESQEEIETSLWRKNLTRRALEDWYSDEYSSIRDSLHARLIEEVYLRGRSLKDASGQIGITIDQAKYYHKKAKRTIASKVLFLLRQEVLDDAHYLEEIRVLELANPLSALDECPEESMLGEFCTGSLGSLEMSVVGEHVESCLYCAPRVHAMTCDGNAGEQPDSEVK